MDTMKVIYNILERLEKAIDEEDFNWEEIGPEVFEISEIKWYRIIEIMINKSLITGISINRSLDGQYGASVYDPRITFEGLEYLAENSNTAKIINAAKLLKDTIPGL